MTILGIVADGVWKGVYSLGFGHSKQLSLNNFFDLSNSSMRKVDDGEKKEKEKKYQPSGAWGTRSPTATPHHLQHPKWPTGSYLGYMI